MAKGLGLLPNEDICVAVYDPVKKELIKICENIKKASVFLDISDASVKKACINKKRRYSPRLDKEVALRYKAKEKGKN